MVVNHTQVTFRRLSYSWCLDGGFGETQGYLGGPKTGQDQGAGWGPETGRELKARWKQEGRELEAGWESQWARNWE